VCARKTKENACKHEKGKVYDGHFCHHVLKNPTDAYEWSFVAVPAQVRAGVIKSFDGTHDTEEETDKNVLDILKRSGGEVTLTKGQLNSLKSYIEKIKADAAIKDRYEQSVKDEVLKLCRITMPGISSGAMKNILDNAGIHDLLQLKDSLSKKLCSIIPPVVQLVPQKDKDKDLNSQFKF
jgi:hypothetical protein